MKRKGGAPRPFLLLDPGHVPVALWVPNLIGYVRLVSFVLAACAEDRTSAYALRLLVLSMVLDYFDGPVARYLNMCSQFGDLLDHVTDHLTMAWLVYITTDSKTPFGAVNNWVSAVCNLGIALGYMAVTGHYFKHATAANAITRIVESNNYWNLVSVLWAANQIVIPIIKLSYHVDRDLGATESTEVMMGVDALGCLVTLVYSFACVSAALAR